MNRRLGYFLCMDLLHGSFCMDLFAWISCMNLFIWFLYGSINKRIASRMQSELQVEHRASCKSNARRMQVEHKANTRPAPSLQWSENTWVTHKLIYIYIHKYRPLLSLYATHTTIFIYNYIFIYTRVYWFALVLNMYFIILFLGWPPNKFSVNAWCPIDCHKSSPSWKSNTNKSIRSTNLPATMEGFSWLCSTAWHWSKCSSFSTTR